MTTPNPHREAGHTPGPWQWVGDDEIEQTEHPFTSVAEVVRLPKNIDPDRKQQDSNALLIAAAPELYEALVALAEFVDRNVNGIYPLPTCMLCPARQAGGEAE